MNKPNGRSLSRIKYMLTGLSVFTVGFLITLGARFYLSLVQIPQTSAFGVANIAVEVVLKLSLALVPVLFIKFMHRESLGNFGIALGETPVRHLVIGAVTAVLWLFLEYVVLVSIWGSSVISSDGQRDMQWSAWVFYFVHLLTLNSLGEEIENRAYLQTVFSRATGTRRGVIISAVLFGISHIPINIYIYHSSAAALLYNVAGASIFGVVAGYLYFITGNILASISLHSAWNVTQFALPLQIDIPSDAPVMMHALSGLANAVILFIILALLIVVHRHKPNWLKRSEAT